MRTRHHITLTACGLLAASGLAACGGDSSTKGGARCPSLTVVAGTATAADADIVVRAIDGIKWDATEYTASSGDFTIYTTNDSPIAHNLGLTCADGSSGGKPIELPSQGSDGAITVTAEPGEYRIICTIPGHSTMDSTLTVT